MSRLEPLIDLSPTQVGILTGAIATALYKKEGKEHPIKMGVMMGVSIFVFYSIAHAALD